MRALSHYSSVAFRLSPSDLARAAARRAYRAAREALYQPTPARCGTLLAAFGATLDSLPAAVLRPRAVWSDVSRRSSVLAAVSSTTGAAERALARADSAAARRFNVFGTIAVFGPEGPIDWSLDAGSGRRYPPVPWRKLRMDAPGMDPKFPWVLGRLDQLIALGQGYWFATDSEQQERYAAAFAAQATHFISANPLGIGIQWSCAMEVSLRATNLALALMMFRDSPTVATPDFLLRVVQSLSEHCDFVEAHLEDGSAVPNNHLIANYVGLLTVGLVFPELPRSARQVELARRGLREQMEAQVHSDGCSFEGSVPYHRLSLELFTLAELIGKQNGIDLGPGFSARLHKMFYVANAYCTQSGRAPQIGDNDSGRALPLRDRASLDHGYLAPLGAALFRDPRLKRPGDEFPDEAAWLLGSEGLAEFARWEGSGPPRTFSSPNGGWHFFRDSLAAVALSAGPNGQAGMGGHSHNDKLSFELHLSGSPVVIDPGTGTYLRDPKLRDEFRGTRAHNTVEVDGREQSPIDPAHPFALADEAHAVVESLQASGSRIELVASHRAYATLVPPVRLRRTLTLDEGQRALQIYDEILGQGSHRAVARLHFPDEEARIREATEPELRRAQTLGQGVDFGSLCVELGPDAGPRAVVILEGGLRPELTKSLYSPSYGEILPALVLVYSRDGELPTAFTTVVLFL